LALFGGLALALAAVGVYGVLSYSVTQQTREIGIRMAMGAERSNVLRLVVTQGLKLTALGLLLGLAGAAAATRLLAGFLFGVGAADPITYAGTAAVFLAVAFAAAYLPALRATRMDPLAALREE
jgi:putative ABC transport system permease protein